MPKLAGTALAVALAVTAIGTWSKPIFVTNAAALATGHEMGLRREQTPAAIIADRFPLDADMLRPMEFMPSPDSIVLTPTARAPGKGDKLVFNMAECGPHDFRLASTGCFAASAKPNPAPPRESAVERRTGPNTSEIVRAPVAAASAPASCKYNLPAATARMERVLARVKGIRARQEPEVCADYRTGLFEMVQARAVTAVCKSGTERDHDLVKIDGAVESINGSIARDCSSI